MWEKYFGILRYTSIDIHFLCNNHPWIYNNKKREKEREKAGEVDTICCCWFVAFSKQFLERKKSSGSTFWNPQSRIIIIMRTVGYVLSTLVGNIATIALYWFNLFSNVAGHWSIILRILGILLGVVHRRVFPPHWNVLEGTRPSAI